MVLSLKNYRNMWLVIGLNEKEFFKIFIQNYKKWVRVLPLQNYRKICGWLFG